MSWFDVGNADNVLVHDYMDLNVCSGLEDKHLCS